MSRYHRISTEFWPDTQELNPNSRLLALYLLTCAHRNLEGLYYLPLEYAKADTGMSWTLLRTCFGILRDRGFIAYDDDAQVVLVRNALRYQRPESPAQVTGAINALKIVPRTTLWGQFLDSCETHAPTLARQIQQDIGDRQA